MSIGSVGQDCFSLREISRMTFQQLSTCVFTFDRKMTKNQIQLFDVKDAKTTQEKVITDVIRNLKCMQGISEEFLPTFRFFQFKKSTSFASVIESEAHSASQRSSDGKVLLTMNDISQKILYDSSRSESDIISLVNQQASQEMMGPVNNMITSNTL